MAAEDTKDLRRIRRLANEALVEIFRGLGGNGWRNKSGWLTLGTDVKQWHGITVNAGSLVSLNLISNDLKGSIPSTISNLVTLTELNMSYNFGLVGVLPPEVGRMTSLSVLHLYSAGIHGPIPESLSLLQNLEELWLNGNRLSGSIPEGLGCLPHLRELYLNANELEGGIPSSFSELVGLEGLNLSWNKLSGDFPSCLGNMASLRLLRLEGNEQLKETPPVEQGPALLKWLADKRAVHADLPVRDLACQEVREADEIRAMSEEAPSSHPASNDLFPQRGDCKLVASRVGFPSLQEVLRDEAGPPFSLEALKAFAASQLAEENIDFWIEVEKFKLADRDGFEQTAAMICSRFIAPGAPMEINLSGSVRRATIADFLSLQNQEKLVGDADLDGEQGAVYRTIFDQAQREIYRLTEIDAFPRFIQFLPKNYLSAGEHF